MALGLGSSSQLGLGISIMLDDRFTNQVGRVRAGIRGLHQDAQQANRIFERGLDAMQGYGSALLSLGSIGVLGFRKAIRESKKFEYEMSAVGSSISDRMVSMDRLKKKAISISPKYGMELTQMAEGLKELAYAGMNSSQIYNSAEAVAALSAATHINPGGNKGGAEIMANIMNAFDIDPSKSMKAANTLIYAANKTSMDVGELYEALKYSASDFRAAKVDLDEASGIFGALSNSGIKGSIAGTSMGNLLREASAASSIFSTKKKKEALEYLGLKPEDIREANGELKSALKIVDTFIGKVQAGNPDTNTAAQRIFGVRGTRGLLPLLNKNNNSMSAKELTQQIRSLDEGYASEIAKRRLNNLEGDIMKFKSAMEVFMNTTYEAIRPALRIFTQVGTAALKLANVFADTVVGKIALFAFGLRSVYSVLKGGLLVGMSMYGRLFLTATTAQADLGAAAGVIWPRITQGILGATLGMRGFTNATVAAQAAQANLTAAQAGRAGLAGLGLPGVAAAIARRRGAGIGGRATNLAATNLALNNRLAQMGGLGRPIPVNGMPAQNLVRNARGGYVYDANQAIREAFRNNQLAERAARAAARAGAGGNRMAGMANIAANAALARNARVAAMAAQGGGAAEGIGAGLLGRTGLIGALVALIGGALLYTFLPSARNSINETFRELGDSIGDGLDYLKWKAIEMVDNMKDVFTAGQDNHYAEAQRVYGTDLSYRDYKSMQSFIDAQLGPGGKYDKSKDVLTSGEKNPNAEGSNRGPITLQLFIPDGKGGYSQIHNEALEETLRKQGF